MGKTTSNPEIQSKYYRRRWEDRNPENEYHRRITLQQSFFWSDAKARVQKNKGLAVYSFVIQDESGEIKVTTWDDVASRVANIITVGDCFQFTTYRIKEANSTYRLTNNVLEITRTKIRDIPLIASRITRQIPPTLFLPPNRQQQLRKIPHNFSEAKSFRFRMTFFLR